MPDLTQGDAEARARAFTSELDSLLPERHGTKEERIQSVKELVADALDQVDSRYGAQPPPEATEEQKRAISNVSRAVRDLALQMVLRVPAGDVRDALWLHLDSIFWTSRQEIADS